MFNITRINDNWLAVNAVLVCYWIDNKGKVHIPLKRPNPALQDAVKKFLKEEEGKER